MCEFAEISDAKVDFRKHTWTFAQSYRFYKWLKEWLLHNPEARDMLMIKVPKSQSAKKKRREKFASYFVLKYGFKIKENEK